jgi:hypothetical protein
MEPEKKVGRPRKINSLAAKGQGINWLGLMEVIKAEKRMVVRCWHPEPQSQVGEWKDGINFEVKQGAPAYQLTTGEIVSL